MPIVARPFEMPISEQLQNNTVETLVITGDEDPVTNVEQAEFLANNIPNASLKVLHARHLASTELPKEYAEVLIDFLINTDTVPHWGVGG